MTAGLRDDFDNSFSRLNLLLLSVSIGFIGAAKCDRVSQIRKDFQAQSKPTWNSSRERQFETASGCL